MLKTVKADLVGDAGPIPRMILNGQDYTPKSVGGVGPAPKLIVNGVNYAKKAVATKF